VEAEGEAEIEAAEAEPVESTTRIEEVIDTTPMQANISAGLKNTFFERELHKAKIWLINNPDATSEEKENVKEEFRVWFVNHISDQAATTTKAEDVEIRSRERKDKQADLTPDPELTVALTEARSHSIRFQEMVVVVMATSWI